jgi:hypothetical protein
MGIPVSEYAVSAPHRSLYSCTWHGRTPSAAPKSIRRRVPSRFETGASQTHLDVPSARSLLRAVRVRSTDITNGKSYGPASRRRYCNQRHVPHCRGESASRSGHPIGCIPDNPSSLLPGLARVDASAPPAPPNAHGQRSGEVIRVDWILGCVVVSIGCTAFHGVHRQKAAKSGIVQGPGVRSCIATKARPPAARVPVGPLLRRRRGGG